MKHFAGIVAILVVAISPAVGQVVLYDSTERGGINEEDWYATGLVFFYDGTVIMPVSGSVYLSLRNASDWRDYTITMRVAFHTYGTSPAERRWIEMRDAGGAGVALDSRINPPDHGGGLIIYGQEQELACSDSWEISNAWTVQFGPDPAAPSERIAARAWQGPIGDAPEWCPIQSSAIHGTPRLNLYSSSLTGVASLDYVRVEGLGTAPTESSTWSALKALYK